MKINKQKQSAQRRMIEKKMSSLVKLSTPPPPSGWLKAVRGSLGMTAKQLSQRLGISAAGVIQLEEREPKKKVTLESLERAANAMDCRLVYALIPNEPHSSLESIIEQQARKTAARIIREVAHTMHLEAQGTSTSEQKRQIERIATELMINADSRIWDMPVAKRIRK